MKRILLIFISIFLLLTVFAQTATQRSLADAYLEKYANYAVVEMQRSGVPASITLAQGMLESNYGRSELATKANNHFGIQCHGDAWKGKKYAAMDSGEMRDFRVYDSALQSYEDHSNFLMKYKRYSKLFELERTDYKGWAYGLKSAGYAEDPAYAEKLIRIIEMYGLDKYDTMTKVPAGEKKKEKEKEKEKVKPVKEKKKKSSVGKKVEAPVVVEVQQEEKHTERQRMIYSYSLSREMYSQNGVPFIYAYDGESYSDIAKSYGLFLSEVLSFNEATEDCKLPCGAVVYLQAKKNKAAKGYDQYVVEEGMGMREISQKFAVKLKRLYKMNDVTEDYIPQVGEVIILR